MSQRGLLPSLVSLLVTPPSQAAAHRGMLVLSGVSQGSASSKGENWGSLEAHLRGPEEGATPGIPSYYAAGWTSVCRRGVGSLSQGTEGGSYSPEAENVIKQVTH